MKKGFLMTVAILLFSMQAFTQTEFGLTGGLNVAKLAGNDANDFESKIGVNLGVLADIWVDDRFSVQPELKYSMQGSQDEFGDEINLDYINLPIKLKYAASENFDIYAGPQIGFNVNAEANLADGTVELPWVKETDFGAVLGADYTSYSGFGVGAGYNFGFNTIDEDEDLDLKNNVFNINLIYMLNR